MAKSIWTTAVLKSRYGSLSIESALADAPEGDALVVNDEGGLEDTNLEFAKLVMEAAEVSADIDTVSDTVAAIDQGETIAAVGESIADREEGATPEEAALIQTGVAQTLDASDAPEEVQEEVADSVATESYGRINVSMEGFRDVLKRMWEATKEFVLNIVDKIKNMFTRWWHSTAGVIKDAKALKKELEDGFEDPKEKGKLESWSGFMEDLAVKQNKFSTSAALGATGHLVTGCKVIGSKFKKSINGLIGLPEKLSTDKGLNPSAIEGVIFTEFDNANGGHIKQVLGSKYAGRLILSDFGDFAVYAGFNTEYSSGDEIIQFISSCKVKADKYLGSSVRPKDFKDDALTKEQCISVCEDVVKAMENLDGFYNKDSKDMYKDVDAAKEKINKLVQSATEEGNSVVAHNLKAAQRVFVMAPQILRGAMSFSVHYIQTAKAYLALVRASKAKLSAKKK